MKQLGVQLYGVLALTREDPERLYATLHQAGYTEVEACIYLDGPRGRIPYWDLDDVAEHVKLLEANGLKLTSCHMVSRDWAAAESALKKLATEYGMKQFVMGCPGPFDEERYTSYAETCVFVAKMLQQWDATLLLHNNFAETRSTVDGITAYEWLHQHCEGLVGLQPDVGWLLYGGVDPIDFLERNAAAVKSLHYKDIRGVDYDPQTVNCCLGDGVLDTEACVRFAAAHNLPQIIDQDDSETDILADLVRTQQVLARYSK